MMNRLKNDPLLLVVLISHDILLYRGLKLILLLSFIFHLVLVTIQSYLFLTIFDLAYLVNYGATYFCSFYILVSLGQMIWVPSLIIEIFNAVEPLSVASPDKKLLKTTKYEHIVFVIFATSLIGCATLSGTFFLWPDPDDADIFFSYAMFEKYLPETWSALFCWLYRGTYPLVAYIMVLPSIHMSYMVLRLRPHVLLIHQFLAYVPGEFKTKKDEELLIDLQYQKFINQKMKLCIHQDVILHRISREHVEKGRILILLYSVFGGLLFISSLFFVLAFREKLKDKFMRLGTFGIAAAGTFIAYIGSGQLVENVTGDTFNVLTEMNWYNWNKENKAIYLMSLMNWMKPYQIKFSDQFTLNYELGIGVLKFAYSVLSVLNVLKNR